MKECDRCQAQYADEAGFCIDDGARLRPARPKSGRVLRFFEGPLRVENILYAFWSCFWILNGLDKFFNGPHWFGVSRDRKMIAYFQRLDLPSWLALSCLYSAAVVEVALGLLFVVMLFGRNVSKVVHRTAFKGSMIVFLWFSIGDILFGDRAELWEHGTFFILVVITFNLYLGRGMVRKDVLGAAAASVDRNRDGVVDTMEFDEFLKRKKGR